MATLSTPWASHLYDLLNRGAAPPSISGVFLRLCTASPGNDGTISAEVSGGSYVGQPIAAVMSVSTTGAGSNTAMIVFPNMPACVVTHWAKCVSDVGLGSDEVIEHDAFPFAITVAAGLSFAVPVGYLSSTVG